MKKNIRMLVVLMILLLGFSSTFNEVSAEDELPEITNIDNLKNE